MGSVFVVSAGLLKLKPEKCCKVVVATAVLHNICQERGVPLPDDVELNNEDADDDGVNSLPEDDGEPDETVRAAVIREHFW
jgi:hypothetical protein